MLIGLRAPKQRRDLLVAVFCPVDMDKCICMPVPNSVLGLEPSHLLKVFGLCNRIKQAHPMLYGVAVLCLNGREIGFRTFDCLAHVFNPSTRNFPPQGVQRNQIPSHLLRRDFVP